MEIENILSKCDHTLLKQTATWEEIKQVLDDAKNYKTASACIPPCFVKDAKEYVKDSVKICTVVGFPNGYCAWGVKAYEAAVAVNEGADEIDMVINVGKVKEGDFLYVLNEIKGVKKACKGKILKVIIETCLLTDDEIVKLCEIVSKSKADYIKTSTGFSTEGATKRVVELMAKNVKKDLKIKAAGGISSLEDAKDFINLGADRLGTSKIVKIVKES